MVIEAAHLDRLEHQLAQTRSTVESLRNLLMQPDLAQAIEHRSVPATPALAIRATVQRDGFGEWWASSITEIRAVLAERGQTASGPYGGLFADELFTDDGGDATVFVPVDEPGRGAGQVQPALIPAVELATVIHRGPHLDVDRAYGALATHVAQAALGVDGPIREYYPSSYLDTADESQWVTEIGWPIFRTATTT